MRKKVRIWTKIFFIVLVALVPTILFTVYTAFSFRSRYLGQATNEMSRLCEVYVSEQRLIVQNAYQMLLSISRTPTVQQHEYAYLNSYFRELMVLNVGYAVILMTDESGTVIASGVNLAGYSLSDREYFNRTLSSGKFTVGSYIISRSTGLPAITYSLPVKDRNNETFILIATYALDMYPGQLSISTLPADAVLEIFDASGKRLFSTDLNDRLGYGEPVHPDLFSRALKYTGASAGVSSIGGNQYLLALNSLTYNGQSLHVSVRRPYKLILAESTRPLIRTLSIMLVALVSAMLLALYLARRLFVNRIERLTEYTEHLAAGNLTVRSVMNRAPDELTELMNSFNKMAQALEERNAMNVQVLEEKEALLRELRKRVSDNLQLISSLVSLQIDHTSAEETKRSLMTAHARVMAMSLVYETLFKFSDVEQVQFKRYAAGLGDFLVSLYADIGSSISVQVGGMDVSVGIDLALPLGLILNELVSNSILHAFPPGRKGYISIVFSRVSASHLQMEIIDDGIGFEKDIRESETLGYEMIEGLVHQVRGELVVDSGAGGTDIKVRFPEAEQV